MMAIAASASGDFSIIAKAGIVTLGLFLGITATAFITKADFSFLGRSLRSEASRFGLHSRKYNFRLFAGERIRFHNGRVRRNSDPLQHVECDAHIQSEPACRRIAYVVCKYRAVVLVHPEHL